MKTKSIAAVAVLVPLLALGCEQSPPVANDMPAVQADFMNGPSDLPNVFRGDSILLFVWADFTRDLVIVVNAPTGGVHAPHSSLNRSSSPPSATWSPTA